MQTGIQNDLYKDFMKAKEGLDGVINFNSEASKDHLQGLLDKCRIDPAEHLNPPKIAIEILNNNGSQSTFGTLGNFSLVIGKAKARKSFLINIVVSAAITNGLILGKFVNHLSEDKKNILYFDTEQGKYHVQLAVKRICRQTNIEVPANLQVYGLRSLNAKDRLSVIEYAIYNTSNLGFVVIDGVKDLVTSINDEDQATDISNRLLKWTEEKEIHITTVLHQNKSDNNARGHIGTELINKSETVLSVTKSESNSDISIVEAQQCRNIEPEPFAFEIDENGLPIVVEDYEFKTETSKNKSDILELENHKKYQLLNAVYVNGESFSYSDLVIQVKLAYKNMFSKTIGNNRIKELITFCKNKNWLVQEKLKAPYTLGKYQTDEI